MGVGDAATRSIRSLFPRERGEGRGEGTLNVQRMTEDFR
jgi:hypothetical protein